MEERKAKVVPMIRYDAIDGLRAYAAIGVLMMHVMVNGFEFSGFVSKEIFGNMGDFVFLFMIISGFSMCCGYYDKVMQNEISIIDFYNNRYKKIIPFFALLCCLDLIISPSINALYELLANLTLCFGLLPNANLSMIGVGWFLGLVFVFYLIFPFFCYLLSDKKRAWFSLIISILLNYMCIVYFFDGSHVVESYDFRTNIIYCSMFFLTGGIIYLYREQVEKVSIKYNWLILIVAIVVTIIYIKFNENIYSSCVE